MVCLYVSLGLFNWVTGLHWLGEFSLPLSIFAGLGLAIASNSPPATISAASTTRNTPEASAPPTEPKDIIGGQSTPPASAPKTVPEPSISFTIHKTVRPQ
ncbi:hypothetical protein [Leptothoe sp. PORK10 BA2]|uniref:hypothetical protein n=1 Tax=Leptothoe sp. PORK10 BA2 TaxID=3110254 RepID=UPI002B2135D8|nr:hypothetical protein [Leptothoe sp. PORK10 BA2]MEA5465752.1 hypothetical protein [Leptothoe sp. PORK10 BA2]